MGMGLNTAYDLEQAKINSEKLLSMLGSDSKFVFTITFFLNFKFLNLLEACENKDCLYEIPAKELAQTAQGIAFSSRHPSKFTLEPGFRIDLRAFLDYISTFFYIKLIFKIREKVLSLMANLSKVNFSK